VLKLQAILTVCGKEKDTCFMHIQNCHKTCFQWQQAYITMIKST